MANDEAWVASYLGLVDKRFKSPDFQSGYRGFKSHLVHQD